MNQFFEPIKESIITTLNYFGIEYSEKFLTDIYIIIILSIPVSLLVYVSYYKYKQRLFVDLGNHKWLIEDK